MKKKIQTNKAPSAPDLLSQGIESNGFIFISGQIHIGTDGNLVKGNMKVKAKKVMENLYSILEASNATFDDVVKVTVYLKKMKEYREFNEIYITYFREPFPAREAVCVKELPLGADIEVSLIAEIAEK